jgi:hypothetical protein
MADMQRHFRVMSYSQARNTELQRLTDPMVWRYSRLLDISSAERRDISSIKSEYLIKGNRGTA